MPQIKVKGGQVDAVDVAAVIAADSTAIASLATGILADPGATAAFDVDYARRDGTILIATASLNMDGESFTNVNNIAVQTINSVAIADYLVATDLGVSVQDWDAGLDSIAGLATVADRMIYTSGSDTYVVTPLTTFARTILDDVDAPAVRVTIGATTDAAVAANHYTKAESDGSAGSAGAKVNKVSGAGTGNVAEFDAAGSIVDSTIASSTVLVSGDLGATVQDWDTNLDDIAALVPADGNVMVGSGGTWTKTDKCRLAEFTVTTTDATLTDLAVIALSAGGDKWVTACFRAHGHEAATGDTISEVIYATAKSLTGVSSLVGAPAPIYAVADAGAGPWSFGIVADDTSDTLKLQVTGEAAHTIIWSACVEWLED